LTCVASLALPQLGDFRVRATDVLLRHRHALAFSNLNPIIESHTVVAPRMCVERTAALSDEEYTGLWAAVRDAQALAEASRSVSASNLLLKDGIAAGSPVPHAHVHIVPRVPGKMEFAWSDLVFELLDEWAPSAKLARAPPVKLEVPPDGERRDRSEEEMAREAAGYRVLAAERDPSLIPATWPAHTFFRFPIKPEQVFASAADGTVLAFVNLRPLAAGHVLVTPRRIVPRLCDLMREEADQLWVTVRRVQALIEAFYGARGCTIGVQDGRDAGQSVPHVHVHVIPVALSKIV